MVRLLLLVVLLTVVYVNISYDLSAFPAGARYGGLCFHISYCLSSLPAVAIDASLCLYELLFVSHPAGAIVGGLCLYNLLFVFSSSWCYR